MKHIFIILFLLVAIISFGQNLVPNPSFEEYEECPWGAAGIYEGFSTGWKSWGWSPDYFNSCSDNIGGYMGVPFNFFGFQNAISGNAYAGLVTYDNLDSNIREYIAIELNQPLIIGQTYHVFFYASLYEGMEGDNSWCASNHIGMRFFKDPLYTSQVNEWLTPNNIVHIDYSEVLFDTLHWTKIEGVFTADQEYNWLAIGNFFDDDNTNYVLLYSEGLGNCLAHYFIENVCVSLNPSDCDYLLSTELNSANKPEYIIYPNPASDYLTIDTGTHSINSFEVVDITGRLVIKSSKLFGTLHNIDIANLPKGMYILKINTNSSIINHKFYKQ